MFRPLRGCLTRLLRHCLQSCSGCGKVMYACGEGRRTELHFHVLVTVAGGWALLREGRSPVNRNFTTLPESKSK